MDKIAYVEIRAQHSRGSSSHMASDMKVWRAADSDSIGQNVGRFCCAETREMAEQYLAGGGLGGNKLFTFRVAASARILDLGDSMPEAMMELYERLAELGWDGLDSIPECRFVWQVLFDLGAAEFLADHYDWIRYADEYPVGCVCWAFIGHELIGQVAS